MIKLTDINDTAFFLNISCIETIYENIDGETTICTTSDEYCCKESTEEVYQKIKETEND